MLPLYTFMVTFVLGASAQMKQECPFSNSISPCICSMGKDQMPWITCDGLSTISQLQKSTKSMNGYSFSNFYIDQSNLVSLPSNLFNGMEIQTLHITFTNLTTIGDGHNIPPFIGLDNSLEDLLIKDVFINVDQPMTSFDVSHLKKLIHLELTNNFVPFIPNDWFESGPYRLERLMFSTSSTKQLGSHAFFALVNIKELHVTGGSVSEISRSMFPSPAKRLNLLDLSNNALTSLPGDIFRGMPSLSEVYLDENAFTTIDENVWFPVWNQLSHVYFFGNPINCDNDIRWIYKYRLPEVLGGSCVRPDNLNKRVLQKLTLKDFQ